MASDKTVQITISAKDQTKAVFSQLASGAEKIGADLLRVGAEGSKGLGQVGSAARASAQDMESARLKYDQSVERMNEKIGEFGLKLKESLSAGIQEIARIGDQAQQTDRQLSAAFDAIGLSAEDFKAQIEDVGKHAETLGINNDAAKQALQALISTTGDAAASFQLIGTAEDLAAAKGISLTAAATLLGKVYDGNTASAKRLGIQVDANASSTQILADISARYAGQAEAHSTVTSRLAAELENEKEKLASIAAGWVPYIAALGQAGEGVSLAISGGKALAATLAAQRASAAEAAIALQAETAAAAEAGVAGEAAAVAEGGMSLGLLGPIGLVAGLSAAAAYLLFFKGHVDDYAKSVADAKDATKNLADTIAGLQSGGQSDAAAAATQAANQWKIAAANITTYKQLASDIAASGYAQAAQDIYAGQVTAGQAPDDSGIANAEEKRVYDEIVALKQLQAQLADGGAAWDAFNASEQAVITNDIGKIFSTQGIDIDAANKALSGLIQQFDNGQISAADFTKQMNEWATHASSDFASATTSSSAAVNALNDQITKLQKLATTDWENAVWNTLDVKPIQDVINTIFSSFDPAAQGFQTGINNILKGLADGTIPLKRAYDDIIALGGQFNGALTAEALAADLASISMADMNAVLDQQAIAAGGTTDALDKLSKAQQGGQNNPLGDSDRTLGALIKEKQAAEAAAIALTHLSSLGPARVIDPTSGQGSQPASFALDSVGLATGNVRRETDLLTQSEESLAASFVKGGDAIEKNLAAWQKTAIGYAQAVGQMPSLVDVLAGKQGANKQLPMADQTFLTSLINVQGHIGEIDQALAAGTITQDQYNLAQKTFNALSVDGAGDVATLVTQLINAKGQYGVIDDLLAQGAITQEQYNELQKIGTEVLKERAQVNFAVIAGMQQSTQTLGDMTRVVIDNTDSIASSSDKLKKWADDLIGPVGTWAKIDKLQQDGRISLEEYNAAQWAQVEIAQTNAKVQEDVQTIQAKQAPLLATLADDQERYLNYISELPAAQQLASLGFMDATESMKAQNLVALAAQAAMGQLGDAGEASATKIIQGAAEADPALQAMLVSMGLIKVGAHGEITVNFSNGDKTQKLLEAINTDLDKLVTLMGGVPDLKVNVDTTDAQAHVDDLISKFKEAKGLAGNPDLPNLPGALKPIAQPNFGAGTGVDTSNPASQQIAGDTVKTITIVADDADAKQKLAETLQAANKIPPSTNTKANVDAADALAKSLEVFRSIGGIPVSHVTALNADASSGKAAVAGFDGDIKGLPESHDTAVSATVTGLGDVNDLGTAIDLLRNKDVYVNTYLQTIDLGNLGRNTTTGSMLGGVIQRHADGGVASILAEAGPEWLDFPNGGHGMAYSKGVYNVPEGTYVHTAPATRAMGLGGSGHVTNNFAPIYIVPTSGNMYETLNQSAIDAHQRG